MGLELREDGGQGIMERHSRIFVAGHRGLAGSAIVRKLRSQGYENLILRTHEELDLKRQRQVEAFFEKERPDYVFLAAAKVGGILANSTFPAEFIYNNLVIETNVIHASLSLQCEKAPILGKFLYLSERIAPNP